MSRKTLHRNERVWPAHVAELGLELADESEAFEADVRYLERDLMLESELLETSLEDYDDLLSLANDDVYEQ